VAESEARLMPVGVVKAFKAPLPPDEDPLVPQDPAARLGHMSAGAPSSFLDEFGRPTEEMPVNDPRQDGSSTRPLPLPAGRNRIKDLSEEEAMELDERDRQHQAKLARLAQMKRGLKAEREKIDQRRGTQQKRRGSKPIKVNIGAPFSGQSLRPKGTLTPGQVRVLDSKRRKADDEFRDLTGVRQGRTAAPVISSKFSTPRPQMQWGRDNPSELFNLVQRKYEDLSREDMPEKYKNSINQRLEDMKAFKKVHHHKDHGWSDDTPWDHGHHGFSQPRGGGKENEGTGKFVGVRGPQTKVDLKPKPEARVEPEPEGPSWKETFLGRGSDLGSLRDAEDPHPFPDMILGHGGHGLGYGKPDHRRLMTIQNKKEDMRGRPPIHDMSMFDEHDEKRNAIKLEHAKKRANTTDPKVLAGYRDKETKALSNHGKTLPKPPESLTSQPLWQDILDWHGRTEAARRDAGEQDIEKSYQVGVRRRLVGVR